MRDRRSEAAGYSTFFEIESSCSRARRVTRVNAEKRFGSPRRLQPSGDDTDFHRKEESLHFMLNGHRVNNPLSLSPLSLSRSLFLPCAYVFAHLCEPPKPSRTPPRGGGGKARRAGWKRERKSTRSGPGGGGARSSGNRFTHRGARALALLRERRASERRLTRARAFRARALAE